MDAQVEHDLAHLLPNTIPMDLHYPQVQRLVKVMTGAWEEAYFRLLIVAMEEPRSLAHAKWHPAIEN